MSALSLPPAQVFTTDGCHNYLLQPNVSVASLFPGISPADQQRMETMLELDGHFHEQRVEFQINGQVGHLSHYNVRYTPVDKVLQWRQIVASVCVPALYTPVYGIVGDQWAGGLGKIVGRKKPKYGYINFQRGLTDDERNFVYQHLLSAVQLMIQ